MSITIYAAFTFTPTVTSYEPFGNEMRAHINKFLADLVAMELSSCSHSECDMMNE